MKKILLTIALLMTLVFVLSGCGFTVERPEVKEGEFNFKVWYEFNGEIKSVSGVYVCKYNGTDWALDGGYHRDWIGYIEGDENEEMLEIGTTEDGGIVKINLALYPEYFMNDPLTGGNEVPVPYISVTKVDGEGMTIYNEADMIEATYGIKILGYMYDSPIENSFDLFN